jgi:ketosteroid isomerase-like protein
MRAVLLALAGLILIVPAAAAADAEETAIVARAEAFFAAMRTGDTPALQAMLVEDATFTAVRVRPDGSDLRRIPAKAWSESLRGKTDLDERMWDPVVMRRGPIAMVRAPYEFILDGKTTHCGVDVFDLVKVEQTWKVAHLMWTQEPDACAELKAKK